MTRPSLLLPLRSGRDWAGGERRDEGGTTLGGAGAASTHTILLQRRGQEQDSDDTSDMSLLFVSRNGNQCHLAQTRAVNLHLSDSDPHYFMQSFSSLQFLSCFQ